MWIEPAAYILTFIVTTGLAVIGIIVSYHLYHESRKPVLQILFYQQVFLIAFFVYGIWGNIALKDIISDFKINLLLVNRLSVIIPILGVPFLVVSWYMLIRLSRVLFGMKLPVLFTYIYFPVFLILLITVVILIQQEYLELKGNPELVFVCALAALNAAVHLFFYLPFLFAGKESTDIKETGFNRKIAGFYLLGVLLYTFAICNYQIFGFISTCISIILLFAGSVLLPVLIKYKIRLPENPNSKNLNFKGFCDLYDISKREAEIILEICTGKTNKAIAEKLFITLQTVKDHNYRIFSKVGVKSRGELTNLVREKTGL